MDLGNFGSILGLLIVLGFYFWGIFLLAKRSGLNPIWQIVLFLFFPELVVLYAWYWGIRSLLNLLRGKMRSRIAEPRATSDEKRQCPDANPR